MSSKGVLQECHLSVSSQGVPQVGSLEVVTISIKSLFLKNTCRHSGSWASSCFFLDASTCARKMKHGDVAAMLIFCQERPGTWPSDIVEDHVVPLSEDTG